VISPSEIPALHVHRQNIEVSICHTLTKVIAGLSLLLFTSAGSTPIAGGRVITNPKTSMVSFTTGGATLGPLVP